MLQDIQGADTGEVRVGERQDASVVELAMRTELAGSGYVGFGDIHAVRLEAGFLKAGHDLADAATDIQCARAGPARLQGIGIFRVEPRIPSGEKVCVGFILPIVRVLVAWGAHGASVVAFGGATASRASWLPPLGHP